MSDDAAITRESISAMAKIVHLDLPEDRLETLVKMYAHFDEGFVKIREIETGNTEPTTLIPRQEATK